MSIDNNFFRKLLLVHLALIVCSCAFSQNFTFKIVDKANGELLPYATIRFLPREGYDYGDSVGYCNTTILLGTKQLFVSSVGYQPKDIYLKDVLTNNFNNDTFTIALDKNMAVLSNVEIGRKYDRMMKVNYGLKQRHYWSQDGLGVQGLSSSGILCNEKDMLEENMYMSRKNYDLKQFVSTCPTLKKLMVGFTRYRLNMLYIFYIKIRKKPILLSIFMM